MPRFANREEYEAWKAGQAAGGSAAAPAATPMTTPPRPAVAAEPPMPATGAAVAAAKPKQGFKETFSGLPPWAWPFIVACFAIPLLTLGGALPTGIGFGAAGGCAQVAKKPDWETPPKVLACAGITVAAWVLVFGVLAALFARR